MAEEKEVNLKGINTVNPDGEPDKNPIIESAKDEVKSADAFITPENARDQTLTGLTGAAISSTKSPHIIGTDFTFDKEISDYIDRLYLPVDLAQGIIDPNERAKFIKNRKEYEEEMMDDDDGTKDPIRTKGSKIALLDEDVIGLTFENELKDLYNFRQQNYETEVKKLMDDLDENQGFFNSLGQFGGNFLGQTALAVTSIIPLVWGVGKAVVNWDANHIFNNTLFDAWDQAQQATTEQFVVYGGADYHMPDASGQPKGFIARMTDNPMKSLNDDIAPAASFIAGAVLTEIAAGMLAPVTGGASIIGNTSRLAAQGTRFFGKTFRVTRGLDTLSDAAKMRQVAVLSQKYRKGLGLATTMVRTAGYESSLIARDTYQSTKNKSYMNYINSDVGMAKGLKQKYEDIIYANTDEFGNLSITQEEALEILEKDIPKKDRIRIENNAKNAGELAWFSNVPLVGFSNMMQFPKIFNSSYRLGQGVIGRAASKINPLTGTKIVGGEMVSRAAGRNFASKALGYSMPVAARTLGESFEEFTQGVFEEGYSDYYSAEFKKPAEDFAIPFFSTMTGAAKKYFKSVEGQDSMLIGGAMGLFGLPFVGTRVKDSGKTGLKFEWYGGAVESIREINQKIEEAGIQSDVYNGRTTNEVLKLNLENTLRGVTIQAEMDKALKEGDIFNFKNQEANSLFSFVQTRVSAGIGDTIMQDLEAIDKMSLADFNEQYAFKDQEFQYTQAQKDQVIQTAKEGVTDAIESIAEKDALLKEERVLVDKILNPKFLGANTYRSFLGFKVEGNIDARVDEFIEQEFEDLNEEERNTLKESFKHDLRNNLAYLTFSEKNLTRREKKLTEQLRDILPEGGLSTLLNDNNYKRFVIGTQKVNIKDKDGNEIDITEPRFDNAKNRLDFAVSQILADIKEQNPDAYNFNEKKIKTLVTDIFKIKDKKAKSAAFYNMLFTKKGAREFLQYKQDMKKDLVNKIVEAATEQAKQRAKKANSSNTVTSSKELAKDLDSKNPGSGSTLRTALSEQQVKEVKNLEKELDAIVAQEELTEYSEVDLDTVLKLLQNKPALFSIVKERLQTVVPGLNNVDLIPVLAEQYNTIAEETGEGVSLEQLIANTVFDIIENQNANLPADPDINVDIDSTGLEGIESVKGKSLEDFLEENFDNLANEGGSTDNFMMLITHDKQFTKGKKLAERDSNGKLIQRKTDQPIKKSLKDINSASVLSDDYIIKNNPKAYFKYAKNEYGKEGAGIENRAIEVYFKDSQNKEIFLGTIPSLIDQITGEQKDNVSPKLVQLRQELSKATVNEKTGVLEIAQEAVTYEGYKATVAPKTETTKETTTPEIQLAYVEEIIENLGPLDQEGEVSIGFAVVDPMNPPGEGESYNAMSKEEATRQVEELNKDRKQTTSPETEVEQTAREKTIEDNFSNIIKQLSEKKIIDGNSYIGKQTDC